MTSRLISVPLDLRTGPPRSPGTHLSGVLRVIATQIGSLKSSGEDLDDIIDSTALESVGLNGTLMRLAIGFAWEEYIFRRLPNVIHQPGELALDDVYGTPDGLEFTEPGDIVLHEGKATFKSSKNGILGISLWMWQAMALLKMLQVKWKEQCRTVVFHPLFIKGDYSGIDPQYLPTEITFEQAEIESVWDMVKRNKHLAKPEEGTPV